MRERRFKKKRIPRCVFLVVCEGETEKTYVEALKHYYRLPITIKTKVSGNKINSRLVNQYIKELDLTDNDEYKVFYIYDADIEHIVEKLKSLQGSMILSNPCIELWYILHYKSHTSHLLSDNAVRLLTSCHTIWKAYTKGSLSNEQSNGLIHGCKDAIIRSKKLSWPDNPSTNMYLLIEALEKCKTS
ncbi:MAG: RloB family protein [Muribaculaceae bacterium]|nr:RloB family protein [Muribaculaceae bacterium]